MIWSGHGVYGSGDYGTKIYYRWSEDTVEAIQNHYSNFPENWQASVTSIQEIDVNRTTVCYWVGFRRTDGCETVKTNLPDYGTLIIFSHSYFAG